MSSQSSTDAEFLLFWDILLVLFFIRRFCQSKCGVSSIQWIVWECAGMSRQWGCGHMGFDVQLSRLWNALYIYIYWHIHKHPHTHTDDILYAHVKDVYHSDGRVIAFAAPEMEDSQLSYHAIGFGTPFFIREAGGFGFVMFLWDSTLQASKRLHTSKHQTKSHLFKVVPWDIYDKMIPPSLNTSVFEDFCFDEEISIGFGVWPPRIWVVSPRWCPYSLPRCLINLDINGEVPTSCLYCSVTHKSLGWRSPRSLVVWR